MSLSPANITIILCVWIFNFSTLLADEPPLYITGRITDENSGKPIPNVNVFIVASNIGSISDDDGRFSLGPLKAGTKVIEFSHLAYLNLRVLRHIKPGETLRYDVRLSEKSIILEEIEIVAEPTIPDHFWIGYSGKVFTRKDIEKTGARRLSDILRVMTPRAYVREDGANLYIDLDSGPGRNVGYPFRGRSQNSNPLVILNGMRIGKSPIGLDFMIKTEEIDVIAILRGIEADMYGFEGRDGVVVIETTPQTRASGISSFQKLLYATAAIGASFLLYFLIFW